MFRDKVLDMKRNANGVDVLLRHYPAFKAYALLMFSAILYQFLIMFESLNGAFFIFQILLYIEACTYLAQSCLLMKNKSRGWLLHLLISVAIIIIATVPFALEYTILHVGNWPLWAFFYFVVGYPLSYLFLGIFSFCNKDIYYKNYLGTIIGVLMVLGGFATLLYALIYGAYMHYCPLSFFSRNWIALIAFNVQYENISLVERGFQFMLLFNALCISNKRFAKVYRHLSRRL